MAIVGPVLAVNSERVGDWLFTRRFAAAHGGRSREPPSGANRDRDFALAEAAMAGAGDDDLAALDVAASDGVPLDAVDGTGSFLGDEHDAAELLAVGADPDADAEPDDERRRMTRSRASRRQAGEQSDQTMRAARPRANATRSTE